MSNEKLYGDGKCYCTLPSGWQTTSSIEIWLDIGLGHRECIAITNDKYYAMIIVDAMNNGKEEDATV